MKLRSMHGMGFEGKIKTIKNKNTTEDLIRNVRFHNYYYLFKLNHNYLIFIILVLF